MMKKLATISIFLLLANLLGCSRVVTHLDASHWKEKNVYEKAVPLQPLEVPPELIKR